MTLTLHRPPTLRRPPGMERKSFALDAAAVDDTGTIRGIAAAYGNVDDGGDVIVAGALSSALPDFLRSGFVSWSHDWSTPIAVPLTATERPEGLVISAKFHSTPEAQEKRVIAQERLRAGLSMGLSIGYGDVQAESKGGIRYLTRIGRLYEVALTMVPMNTSSLVTEAKSAAAAPTWTYAVVPESTVAWDTVVYAKRALELAEWMTYQPYGSRHLAWFRPAGPAAKGRTFEFDRAVKGAVLRREADTLHIAADLTPREVLSAVGHEFMHSLQFEKLSPPADLDAWEPEADRFGALLDQQLRALIYQH